MSTSPAAPRRARLILPSRVLRGGVLDPHEMPFTLLVVGDLLAREDARPIEDRRPIRVRPDNLAKVKSVQRIAEDGPPIWQEIERLVGAIGGEPGVELARVRVTGPADKPWRRELALDLEAHAGSAGKLGPIHLEGWIDME